VASVADEVLTGLVDARGLHAAIGMAAGEGGTARPRPADVAAHRTVLKHLERTVTSGVQAASNPTVVGFG
jgi:hypothetical protein